MTPWETVCIDLIGPYTVTDRSGNDRILNAMTFVDDNGNEFKRDFLPLLRDFSIKPTPTTIKNPQANAILERVHQVLGVEIIHYQLCI